jgi:Fe-coproporphyrin III synthase
MFARKFRLFKKIIRANFNSLEMPYKLIFAVTKECHSRCSNCNIWKVKPHNELKLDEIKQIAKNSPFLSWLNLTGGEPTDRPDLVEIIATFIQSCPDLTLINFPTNGINTKRIIGTIERLVALNPPELVVIVSLDGPPEVNDKLRGIRNDFSLAVETYKQLKRFKKVKSMIGMTLFEENHHLVDQTIEALQLQIPEFEKKDLHVNIQTNSGHLYENAERQYDKHMGIALSVEKLMKDRGWHYFNPVSFLERGYQKRVRKYIETGKSPIDCAALSSSIYLSEVGEIYPCTVWSESLGNIRNQNYSFVPALKSNQRAEDLRNQILKKDCPNCWSPCEASQSIVAQVLRV